MRTNNVLHHLHSLHISVTVVDEERGLAMKKAIEATLLAVIGVASIWLCVTISVIYMLGKTLYEWDD